jgi:hypothetical protein
MFPADAAADFPCPFSFLTFALQLFFTELLPLMFGWIVVHLSNPFFSISVGYALSNPLLPGLAG